MKPSLGQLLVAAPGQLQPQHARAQNVQMPQALPQGLRYGNVTPGLPQSQRFTGAVAQQQPMSQINAPPDFAAPSYTAPVSRAGLVASALAAALGGGTLGGFGGFHPPGGGPGPSGQQTPTSRPPVTVIQGQDNTELHAPHPGPPQIFSPNSSSSPSGDIRPPASVISSPGFSSAPPSPVSGAALALLGRRGVYQF